MNASFPKRIRAGLPLDDTDRAILARMGDTPTLSGIAGHAAAHTGRSLAVLRGPRRDAPIVRVRQRIAYIARALGYSYPRIGMTINRHHTTVMDLVRNEQRRRTQA